MVTLSLDFGNSDPTSTKLDPGTAEIWHGTQGVGGPFIDGEEEEEDDDDGMGVAREANSGAEDFGDNEKALGGEVAWHVVDGVDQDERCLRFEGAVGEISLSRTSCFPFSSSLCCPCSSRNVRASAALLMKVSSSKDGCSTLSMISPFISCLSQVSVCVPVHCFLRATGDGVLIGLLPLEWGWTMEASCTFSSWPALLGLCLQLASCSRQ